ncbi:MAG: hypothetical protein ACREAD_04300 [Nitrosopumilaceae archaeon]
MSVDREEIQWKFQILSNLVNSSIERLEQERQEIVDGRNAFERRSIRYRNEFLSGIGFFISLIMALITIDIWPKHYILYVIFTVVIGLAIFTLFNELMYWKIKKYSKLINLFDTIDVDELINFQNQISTMAILDTISINQIKIFTVYYSLLTAIASYEIGYQAHKLLKTMLPSQEEYLESYKIAKSSIENYRKSDFIYSISRIEKFIHDFEKYNNSKNLK